MTQRTKYLILGGFFLLSWGVSYLRYKTIAITFRDMVTHAPIIQAHVETNTAQIEQADRETHSFRVSFTANPFFADSSLPLKVLAPGYRPGSLSLIIPREQLYPQIEIYLEPTHITGQVIDAINQQPLSGVTLQAGQHITQTDKSGTFHFYRLWLHDHIAIQTPRGYQPISGITLQTMTDLSEPLVLELAPTVITGQAISQTTGNPLAQVQLSAGFGAYQQTVTTNTEGYFTFYRLSPDDIITVKSPEYAPLELLVGTNQKINIYLNLLHQE